MKEDFDADFRRIRKAGHRGDGIVTRELSRDGDEAVASASRAGLTETSNRYTASYHRVKGQYQELLMQWEKAKKRATVGGSTVFEYFV
jgi:hypothetical protein